VRHRAEFCFRLRALIEVELERLAVALLEVALAMNLNRTDAAFDGFSDERLTDARFAL